MVNTSKVHKASNIFSKSDNCAIIAKGGQQAMVSHDFDKASEAIID
jgi:hypothetical protein